MLLFEETSDMLAFSFVQRGKTAKLLLLDPSCADLHCCSARSNFVGATNWIKRLTCLGRMWSLGHPTQRL